MEIFHLPQTIVFLKQLMLLEFRVPLPYCVEDPTVGYLYMCMEANLQATGGGEGVDWIKNEPYSLDELVTL